MVRTRARESGGDVGIVATGSRTEVEEEPDRWASIPPVGERMSRWPACMAGPIRDEVGQAGPAKPVAMQAE
ncbi:hypothetical protein E2562_033460 [Oryza meyeriana var. granulata]|uniref:Uncharacterized protein n=1 Tax=Oryza meyeriana var. granulata TaxID=110450 RepID=A0A6G1E5U7_9ORYZ|nr:hypothetical protein E2562_033460 [Oryza meyeriana var. granulata]